MPLVSLRPDEETYRRVREAAKGAGESANGWMLRAIWERLEREGSGGVGAEVKRPPMEEVTLEGALKGSGVLRPEGEEEDREAPIFGVSVGRVLGLTDRIMADAVAEASGLPVGKVAEAIRRKGFGGAPRGGERVREVTVDRLEDVVGAGRDLIAEHIEQSPFGGRKRGRPKGSGRKVEGAARTVEEVKGQLGEKGSSKGEAGGSGRPGHGPNCAGICCRAARSGGPA